MAEDIEISQERLKDSFLFKPEVDSGELKSKVCSTNVSSASARLGGSSLATALSSEVTKTHSQSSAMPSVTSQAVKSADQPSPQLNPTLSLNAALCSCSPYNSISLSQSSSATALTSPSSLFTSRRTDENSTAFVTTAAKTVPADSSTSMSALLAVAKPADPYPAYRIPPNVLSEEDYVSTITDIVERDYFPDLPRLRVLHELQQAESCQDVGECLRLEKYLSAMSPAPSNSSFHYFPSNVSAASPATWNVPVPEANVESHKVVQLLDGTLHCPNTNCSLDTFQATYTSEDNLSFEELLNAEKRMKRNAQAWIEGTEYKQNLQTAAIADATKKGEKSLDLATNIVVARNPLMFTPTGVPNEEQPYYQKVHLQKQLNSTNTRFNAMEKQADALLMARVDQIQRSKEKTMSEKERALMVADGQFKSTALSSSPYPYVHTPVLVPGVGPDQSPLMTWGKVASTPLLMPAADTADASNFKIPDPLPRERAAKKLQDQASLKVRDRKRKNTEGVRTLSSLFGGGETTSLNIKGVERGLASLSPSSSTPNTLRLRELAGKSPLVRQLFQGHSQPSSSVDQQLRAAYSGKMHSGGENLHRRTARSGLHTPSTPSRTPLFSPSPLTRPSKDSLQLHDRSPSVASSYHSADTDDTADSKDVVYIQKHIYVKPKSTIPQAEMVNDQAAYSRSSSKLTPNDDTPETKLKNSTLTDDLLHI
ncbi:hypothetical protein IE077_001227 [Cardiosporidium cionae]|uniref:Uncharacterized protein n=1 Tax=Cardiosporidium cionae TaxID=476202 RepID=A0ABQ7JED5_9APIC|nr:hypothetical protein IE077_001227 [Cardiosporidium cionae]|eukprot:KAF8822010.1 hypothetical protein IE077_001227 [Cardiosporidium cionae]